VRGARPSSDLDLREQRRVIDAFLAASRAGDFEALLEVLDPDVVFRIDAGGVAPRARPPIEGAEAVAAQILERGARLAPHARPAIVNGYAGLIVVPHEKPIAVVGFVITRRPDRRDRPCRRSGKAAGSPVTSASSSKASPTDKGLSAPSLGQRAP